MVVRKIFQITNAVGSEIELSVEEDNIVIKTTDETSITVAHLILDDAAVLGKWLQEVSE